MKIELILIPWCKFKFRNNFWYDGIYIAINSRIVCMLHDEVPTSSSHTNTIFDLNFHFPSASPRAESRSWAPYPNAIVLTHKIHIRLKSIKPYYAQQGVNLLKSVLMLIYQIIAMTLRSFSSWGRLLYTSKVHLDFKLWERRARRPKGIHTNRKCVRCVSGAWFARTHSEKSLGTLAASLKIIHMLTLFCDPKAEHWLKSAPMSNDNEWSELMERASLACTQSFKLLMMGARDFHQSMLFTSSTLKITDCQILSSCS